MTRILLVEDDPDLRDGIADLLRAQGHEVRGCENGFEALRVLRAGYAADVILLDLMMPVMNGWEFRAMQRRDARIAGIPVILISGAGSLAAHAQELEAAGALAKPFDVDDLARTLISVAGAV